MRAVVLAIALASAACTVVSGVDDMELRSSSSPVAPSPGGDAGAPPNPFGSVPDASSPPAEKLDPVGPLTCGAAGSWQGCESPAPLDSCATICAAKGFACVDSCCANDELGDYAAKVGMVYALASECSLPSMTSVATFGLCADPLVLPAGFGEVRCCCK